MLRTLIIHSLVPNYKILEFQNATFGQDADDDDYEVWFRNTYYAGMVQQLMHHTLNAWDDCLPNMERITCDEGKENAMLNHVEIFRSLGSPLSAEFRHQNFCNQFKIELGGDPVLFPTEANQFSAVVDKVMVGTTADMCRLADEAIKAVYIPSESRRSDALLPKNHMQTEFGIKLRLTTLNFYANREKTSGVLSSVRVGTGCCVCMLFLIEKKLDKREISQKTFIRS